ncbi:dipeptide/oligopeptide/nickel ABC transporter permease/ATP-binding protein [Micrococcales bacterium 31B]|nr:dipeptide/oligopeptide/nickel ABC transporter permease/ATP-binding protein [Micrococcales bacterium 31B]
MRKKLTERLSQPGIKFRGLTLSTWIAVAVLALIVLACIVAPAVARLDPIEPTENFAVAPNGTNWFGTDLQGRDVFARVLYGGRWSLAIGLGATLVALVLGSILGAAAATANKLVSGIIMRVLDIIMAFPVIALAALFVTVFGRSIPVLIGAIGFLYMPSVARVVRANVLAQYGEDYVAAEKVIGAPTPWIVVKHVVVNCAAPVLVFATIMVADAIVFEASLSFIGAGIQPPDPSWGSVIKDGQLMVLDSKSWTALFPGLFILATVVCLNMIAEGITDAMANPALRRIKARKNAPAAVTRSADVVREAEQVATGGAKEATGASRALAAVPLEEHLDRLRAAESQRDDRLHFAGSDAALIEVQNLSIYFPERYGDIAIVDNISFKVHPSETMALVGESGCGKSLTSLAIMGLLPKSARVTGKILFQGRDLLTLTPSERNALRGHDMSMIYQDALSSLNPSMKISAQMGQLIRRGGTRSAEDLLNLVGLDAKRTLGSYPHELSGGQRQRVLIAMSLTRDPKLVVADEPTTALDVTVQKQVVDLLNELREKLGFAMIFVSHDLALVASLAHRITVMYAGQVVESGKTRDLLMDPRHEYTRGLLGSVLSVEDDQARLHQIPGTVPSPRDFPNGDRFAPRSVAPDADPNRSLALVEIPGSVEHFYAARAGITPAPAAEMGAK